MAGINGRLGTFSLKEKLLLEKDNHIQTYLIQSPTITATAAATSTTTTTSTTSTALARPQRSSNRSERGSSDEIKIHSNIQLQSPTHVQSINHTATATTISTATTIITAKAT